MDYLNIIDVDGVLVSVDILREKFSCDYSSCGGVCCRDGDAGAPITASESKEIAGRMSDVLPMLTDAAREVLDMQGVSYVDQRGNLATSIIFSGECVFALKDSHGRYCCAIQNFKPISCSLYPIRVKELASGITALNYSEWDICRAARIMGASKGIPIYKFLEEPLRRRFGSDWYDHLCTIANSLGY